MPHIERIYTKFNFDAGKCRSYLDLHHPEIAITDDIIARCRAIFFRILYNCDDWEIEDCIITPFRDENWPLLDRSLMLKLFVVLLYCDINCDINVKYCISNSEVDSEDSDYEPDDIEYIKLPEMLLSDTKYDLFLTTWPDCTVGKILITLTLVSRIVLCESNYYSSGFPGEITELIVCSAFSMLHNIELDDEM